MKILYHHSFVAYWRLRGTADAPAGLPLRALQPISKATGVWLKRHFNLTMPLEFNASVFEERAKYDGAALPWLARWSARYPWRGADYVLAVTEVLGPITPLAPSSCSLAWPGSESFPVQDKTRK